MATVLDQQYGGSADIHLAALCQRESRTLVTLDMDFADIRAYPPAEFPGFPVLRLRQLDKPHVLDVLARLIELLGREPLDRRLWIVDEKRIRIRG